MCLGIQRKAHEDEDEDIEWRRMSMRCTIGLGECAVKFYDVMNVSPNNIILAGVTKNHRKT